MLTFCGLMLMLTFFHSFLVDGFIKSDFIFLFSKAGSASLWSN